MPLTMSYCATKGIFTVVKIPLVRQLSTSQSILRFEKNRQLKGQAAFCKIKSELKDIFPALGNCECQSFHGNIVLCLSSAETASPLVRTGNQIIGKEMPLIF